MKARRLVEGAAFGPQALKVACEAFDQAWDEIAGNFGNDRLAIESARLQLANAILSVAGNDSRDPAEVKTAALQMLAMSQRLRSD